MSLSGKVSSWLLVAQIWIAQLFRSRVPRQAQADAARPVARGDWCDHALGGAGGGDRATLPEAETRPSADPTGADVRGAAVLQPVG